jgi:uncharacterized protein (TIGR03435 family)
MKLRTCAVLPFVMLLRFIPAMSAQDMPILDPGTKVEARVVKTPVYDVISVKPNKTGSGSMSISIDDGNFKAVNVSAKMMILDAWALKESQLMEVPKWAGSDRFDITAKVLDPDPAVFKKLTNEQNQEMLQPILTERFGLKFHREKKVLPIYELVVAKDGPKFAPSKFKQGSDEKAPNGMGAGSMMVNNTNLQSVAVPISSLVGMLSGQLQRVVVDKTGLTDDYDLALKWSPSGGAAAGDDAPPEIFTALQEQLGLKLVASKAEIETFVVDQITQPTEN